MFTDTSSHLNEASYRICYLFAQHQVPFTHADLFKKAFMASAKVLFAGFQNKDNIVQQIGKLPLSPDTCARRCDELSGDIFTQLMTKLPACPAFSLALDESTDKSDTAQRRRLLLLCKPFYCGASYLPNIVANVYSQRSRVAGQFHRFQGGARTKKLV